MTDLALRQYSEGRLLSLRVTRYSWWTHWRELADNFLPRRYRWLITPNQWNRGSPINQHIIDSAGVLAARNLASGLYSGKSSPTRIWFKMKIGKIDSTGTNPISLWLAEVERLILLVLQESNFYDSIAQLYADLVVFGTAVMLIYEDFDNVIVCYNPAAGEYYIDLDGKYRPCILYREFTMTINQIIDMFGLENCPEDIRKAVENITERSAALAREYVIAHSIEPNDDGNAERLGFSKEFAYRETYWVWGSSQSPQNRSQSNTVLRKRGYYSRPNVAVRWDIISNDPYGRSPAMDALGDQKQLQQEQRRKAQGIDKMVNPPLVADVQLKNQPASLLPGGITYVTGFASSGKPGLASVYDSTKFPVNEMKEDIAEVQNRIKRTFYNDLFQTASQFETRSNITAVEWDMRKAESMVMLGPVVKRLDNEGLAIAIDRVYDIMDRAGIIPPPPPEIAGAPIEMEFVSMLALAQQAAAAAGIERVFGVAGNLAGLDPAIVDKIDMDYAMDKYSSLMGNDPKIIRSNEAVEEIRTKRQEAAQAQQQAEMVEKYAKGAKVLADTQVGGGQNALAAMTGLQ